MNFDTTSTTLTIIEHQSKCKLPRILGVFPRGGEPKRSGHVVTTAPEKITLALEEFSVESCAHLLCGSPFVGGTSCRRETFNRTSCSTVVSSWQRLARGKRNGATHTSRIASTAKQYGYPRAVSATATKFSYRIFVRLMKTYFRRTR